MVQGSSPCAPTMKHKDVTYNDKPYREETKRLWKDMGSNDWLVNGPVKDVDLVSTSYDVEVAFTTIQDNRRTEWRIEDRKLRYWKRKKPCHYVLFNKQKTKCIVVSDKKMRTWINKYDVEYRDCNGWKPEYCNFLIVPLTERVTKFKKINNKWTKCD